jgi:hypothetical protein
MVDKTYYDDWVDGLEGDWSCNGNWTRKYSWNDGKWTFFYYNTKKEEPMRVTWDEKAGSYRIINHGHTLYFSSGKLIESGTKYVFTKL